MCRFTTQLFNSPSLPGAEEFSTQIKNVCGLDLSAAELEESGRWITGLERMINHKIGVRAADDTLPERWFEEGATAGPFQGEKIDRAEFEALRSRFYRLTGLDAEGQPAPDWRHQISKLVTGFAVRVRLPEAVPGAPDRELIIDRKVDTLKELSEALAEQLGGPAAAVEDRAINLAVNGDMVLSGQDRHPVQDGDQIELIRAFSGG
jgi:aldehyde:ferredoxin oxidoreductase